MVSAFKEPSYSTAKCKHVSSSLQSSRTDVSTGIWKHRVGLSTLDQGTQGKPPMWQHFMGHGKLTSHTVGAMYRNENTEMWGEDTHALGNKYSVKEFVSLRMN